MRLVLPLPDGPDRMKSSPLVGAGSLLDILHLLAELLAHQAGLHDGPAHLEVPALGADGRQLAEDLLQGGVEPPSAGRRPVEDARAVLEVGAQTFELLVDVALLGQESDL